MDLSIILPIFNEEEVIEESILNILKKAEKITKNLEVLAVNDGSIDSTNTILNRLAKKDKRIRVITHSPNKGYGAVLKTGIKEAKYDWLFFTDADMQFDISELVGFFPFTKDYDYVIGKRLKRADAPRRVFISGVYNRILRFIFQLPIRDVDCAFKLMRRKTVESIPFKSDSFFVSAELMIRSIKKGVKIKELGVHHYPRIKGES
ncbi:MAG: glycosyltransferase family 2 protein, partial [Patescibacteria group bacterium]